MREYLRKAFGSAVQVRIVHSAGVEEKFFTSEPSDRETSSKVIFTVLMREAMISNRRER